MLQRQLNCFRYMYGSCMIYPDAYTAIEVHNSVIGSGMHYGTLSGLVLNSTGPTTLSHREW